jgi:ABC-type sugar transport system ATPase subunit
MRCGACRSSSPRASSPHHRPVGLGQVHAAQPARPARHADIGARSATMAPTPVRCANRAAPSCATGSSASSSSSTTCCPSSASSRTSRCPRSSQALPPAEIRSRAEETLGLLGLAGLEGKNANALSGGQKQRVAIARALMNRPALVLADEPTGNLDTTNTDLVYDLFRRVNSETGTAFLIVTHDRAVAQRTDRILEVGTGSPVGVSPALGATTSPRISAISRAFRGA